MYGKSGKCSHLEVETCTEDLHQCHCIPCHPCPPGQGLEPQCGGQSVIQIPQCVPCKNGVNYSSKKNVGSCEPCPICHGMKVVQPCNATHPTVCSESCDEGFKYNEVVGDCEEVATIEPPSRTPRKPKDEGKPHELVNYGGPGKYFKIYLFTSLALVVVLILVVLFCRCYCPSLCKDCDNLKIFWLCCCPCICLREITEVVCQRIVGLWRRQRNHVQVADEESGSQHDSKSAVAFD